jgi:uncharacterized membrane protein YhaH (DUF805 family)
LRDLLRRLGDIFTLNSPSLGYRGIWICVAILWIVVVVCTLSSIASRPFRRSTKRLWAALVIAVPLLGVLAYLPFSVSEELFPYIGFWRKPRH